MPEVEIGRFGPYEVVGEIGRTGLSVVLEAVEPVQKRTVTLAVTADPVGAAEEEVRAFWDEAMKLAELRHPNVARVIDRGREGDHLYLVEEHVSGVALDRLTRERRLSIPEALTVFKALCNALEVAHAKGLLHHEVTPSQVLVSEDLSVIKLRGFGMRHLEQAGAESGTMVTTRGVYSGLSYMSPEQAKNQGFVDERSNVYSVGVIFYELLTGRVPRGRIALPSQLNNEVPSEIDALVLKCMASDPGERFPSMAELKGRFSQVESQLRLGLLHELQGLQRSTAKMLRRGDADVSTAIDLAAPAPAEKARLNPALLWGVLAVLVAAAVLLIVILLA